MMAEQEKTPRGGSRGSLQPARQGGHFAAWEQPQLLTEEIRVAFRSLR
jgi:hypothetical protein